MNPAAFCCRAPDLGITACSAWLGTTLDLVPLFASHTLMSFLSRIKNLPSATRDNVIQEKRKKRAESGGLSDNASRRHRLNIASGISGE